MTDLERLGPIYDLPDGIRLQDLDGGCGTCGKRLAEVVHDSSARWNAGQIICVDCGTLARLPQPTRPTHDVRVKPSRRAPGLYVAVCTCHRFSMVAHRAYVEQWASRHQQEAA